MVVVAGAADAIVPVGNSARPSASHFPQADLTIFPGDVGHYVFVEDCTQAGRATLPALCIDAGRRPPHDSREDGGPRRGVLRSPSAIAPQAPHGGTESMVKPERTLPDSKARYG